MHHFAEKHYKTKIQNGENIFGFPFSAIDGNLDTVTGILREDINLLAEKLYTKFHSYSLEGTQQIHELAILLESLQNIFLDILFALFKQQAINMDKKITLSLNNCKNLSLTKDHPDANAIAEIFSYYPHLSKIFTLISTCSLFIHQLNRMHALANCSFSSGINAENYGYHLNIKGEMSHFFISYPS